MIELFAKYTCSEIWGHLKERKSDFFKHQIDQKYSEDIVNIVNDLFKKWNIYIGVQKPIICKCFVLIHVFQFKRLTDHYKTILKLC